MLRNLQSKVNEKSHVGKADGQDILLKQIRFGVRWLGKIREPQTNDQQRWCDVGLVQRPVPARGVTTVILDVDGIVESALS
jgi:hypothetical protein